MTGEDCRRRVSTRGNSLRLPLLGYVSVGSDPWRTEHVKRGQNKVFADRLMGRDSAERTPLSARTRERSKTKMRVALRAFSLVSERTVEWRLRREEKGSETKQRAKQTSGPITDGNQPHD